MTTPRPLPYRPQPAPQGPEPTGLRAWLRPSHWVGALVIMVVFTAVLYVVQAVNEVHPLVEYGLVPRRALGLRGVVTEPFLHADWNHLLSNTLPFLLIGWVVLLAGLREWLFVTVLVIVAGGLLTWAVAPGDQVIVGASGLVFGWLGYLLARAVFSRMFRWIVTAVIVLICFGTLLFGLLPGLRQGVSWQSHLSGFVVGVALAALIHDPRGGPGLLGRIAAPRKGSP